MDLDLNSSSKLQLKALAQNGILIPLSSVSFLVEKIASFASAKAAILLKDLDVYELVDFNKNKNILNNIDSIFVDGFRASIIKSSFIKANKDTLLSFLVGMKDRNIKIDKEKVFKMLLSEAISKVNMNIINTSLNKAIELHVEEITNHTFFNISRRLNHYYFPIIEFGFLQTRTKFKKNVAVTIFRSEVQYLLESGSLDLMEYFEMFSNFRKNIIEKERNHIFFENEFEEIDSLAASFRREREEFFWLIYNTSLSFIYDDIAIEFKKHIGLN